MGLATTSAAASVVNQVIGPRRISVGGGGASPSGNPMSHGFHQGIFSFSASEQEQQHHVAQQSRRDKLRMQGFEPGGGSSAGSHHARALVGGGIEEDDGDNEGGGGVRGIYEAPGAVATNMLSEMFNFPQAAAAGQAGPTATELLASQIHGAGYRFPSRPAVPGSMVGFGSDEWYGGDGGSTSSLGTIGGTKQLNPESAAAMQLFLMNPQQQHQPRSPPHQHQQEQLFHEASFSGGQLVDSHGLSLSLSSSLHQFEMAKAEQNVLYFNQNQQAPPQLQQHHHQQQSEGYGAPVGASLQLQQLRNSRYARAAQELLEEFCSVGRGQLRGGRGKHHGGSSSSNPNPSGAAAAAAAVGSSSSSKDVPPLSPADRFEHQRNKSKLLTMLDEASGQKIQPLLRPDADGGDLVRLGDGVRRGDPVHGAGAEGDVAALPVPEGRDRGAAEEGVRGAGREGHRGRERHNQGGDAEAPAAGPEPQAAEGLPPDGDDRAGGVAAAAGTAGALGYCPPGLAFRTLPSPVRIHTLSTSSQPFQFLLTSTIISEIQSKIIF
ncbi:putative BEL1-like homeodomain protein 4 [Iris pallida]|uniref:BEL1-like homeodomain protein 4 n=1 Tax=Iris pallida TaxID=29817 RepID=A0AAX6FAV3_IRIPA|nr:putative BEL1-like homeodomain protein 4 [Iris pallida]